MRTPGNAHVKLVISGRRVTAKLENMRVILTSHTVTWIKETQHVFVKKM